MSSAVSNQNPLEDATAQLKPSPERTLDNLLKCLPLYNSLYILQSGDRKWSAMFMRNDKGELGFFGEDKVFYMSPDEIAAAHPHQSGTGSGWDHLRISCGLKKGTSISKLLARHCVAH